MSEAAGEPITVITGAAGGLGRVIASYLHAGAHRVVVSDIDEKGAVALAEELDPSGTSAIALALDVSRKADFEDALQRTVAHWGSVQVLVNNAALTKTTPIFEISSDEFDAVMRVNLRGVFLGCQVFGRYFRDAKYGRIINMASLAAQNGGSATGAHYAASKGGILTLTKVFARDLAASGVTVNAIAPGPLDVPLVREILEPATLDALVRALPVGHLGDPRFIAQLVAVLASKDAGSVTGATWDANGGLYLR